MKDDLEDRVRALTLENEQLKEARKGADDVSDTLSKRIAELEKEVVELTYDCMVLAQDNRERRHKMVDMEKTISMHENTISRLEKEKSDLLWGIKSARDEIASFLKDRW